MPDDNGMFSYDAKVGKIYTTPVTDDLKLTDMQALVVALSIIGEKLGAIEKQIGVAANIMSLK